MNAAAREVNAAAAIAARDVARMVKSPSALVFSVVFPVIFVGVLGGSIAQNLAAHAGFNYLQFVLVGMIASTLYMTTISGVTALIEDRENDFTQELFVAPVSRYAITAGKICGSAVASLALLPGIIVVALALRIPLDGAGLIRLLLLTPVLSVAGGALGMLFIGFVRNPQVAGMGAMLLVFPQMFLSGAFIPVRHSSGVLGLLARAMPMTYCVDLARGAFYAGSPAYHQVVLYPPAVDLAVTAAFFLIFIITGTVMFTRAERSR
jgi:ABC-2 type transport system permease protein